MTVWLPISWPRDFRSSRSAQLIAPSSMSSLKPNRVRASSGASAVPMKPVGTKKQARAPYSSRMRATRTLLTKPSSKLNAA